MSEGPISQQRAGTRSQPIPRWKPGTLVTPNDHPPTQIRWKVEAQTGSIVDLIALDPGPLTRTSRTAYSLTKIDE